MKKNNGFILLSALLIILIISLLVLSSMQHVLMYFKVINRLELQHQYFYQMERTALELAKKNKEQLNKGCLLAQGSPNRVINKLANNEGCSIVLGGSSQYRYFIEELSDFPCLTTAIKNNKYSSHQRRVTIVQNLEDKRMVLQINYLSLIPYISCTKRERTIHQGISSWRYLVDV